MAAANELVKKLSNEEGVDKSKIYISGLSMGGMGTFESVYRYPDLYAAALPICGGGDVNHYDKRVAKVPFWVFHGAADAVVNRQAFQGDGRKIKIIKSGSKIFRIPRSKS